MKKICLLIISIITVNAFAQQKDTLSYYTDLDLKPVAKEKAKITFKVFQSGAKSWIFLQYNAKNVLELKETYADSLLTIKHGQYVTYSFGKPSLKGTFFNNMKHGNFVSYDTAGVAEDVSLYNLDTLKTNLIYFKSGGKREEKIYRAKNQIAERFVYYENGNLAIKQSYSTDNRVIEATYLDIDGKTVKLTDIESPPTFAGGIQRFYEYIARNLKYPTDAAKSGIQGSVSVSFVVTETGDLTNVKVVKSADPMLDREAINVVKSSPKWIPGKLFGKNVKVTYSVPINFSINER